MRTKRINTDLYDSLELKNSSDGSLLDLSNAYDMHLYLKKEFSSIALEQQFTITDNKIYYQYNSNENNTLGTYDLHFYYKKNNGNSEIAYDQYHFDISGIFQIVKSSEDENWSGGVTGVYMQYGTDGLSAYQLAVKGGFTGTEAEWIESLKLHFNDLTESEIVLLQKPAADKANELDAKLNETTEFLQTAESTENDRKASEAARKSDEALRSEAESVRIVNENARNQAEAARELAESARGNSEDSRKAAESDRESSEAARESSEAARESSFSESKTASDAATEAANNAAQAAQNSITELNIDKLYPLQSGYYTLSTAIDAVATQLRSINAKITFKSKANTVETWVFISTIDGWNNVSNWQPFGSVEQTRSQNNNTAPSSKLFDDNLNQLSNNLSITNSLFVTTANFDKSLGTNTNRISDCIKAIRYSGDITNFRIGLNTLLCTNSNNTTSEKVLSFKISYFNLDNTCSNVLVFTKTYPANTIMTSVKETINAEESFLIRYGMKSLSFDLDFSKIDFSVWGITDSNTVSPISYSTRGFDLTKAINLITDVRNQINKLTEQTSIFVKTASFTKTTGNATNYIKRAFEYIKIKNAIVGKNYNYGLKYFLCTNTDNTTSPKVLTLIIRDYDDNTDVLTKKITYPAETIISNVIEVITVGDLTVKVNLDYPFGPLSITDSNTVESNTFVYRGFEDAKIIKEYVYPSQISTYNTVLSALQVSNKKFTVGNRLFNSKLNNPNALIFNANNTDYNSYFKQYLIDNESFNCGKLIKENTFNMYPTSLDNADYFLTYYRQIIGIDSEGWVYVAQRKTNNDLIDSNVKIQRTKDFSTYEDYMIGVGGIQLIELENGELCFAAYTFENDQLYCSVYITSNNKTIKTKKFVTTTISQTNVGYPWSWGIQTRGSMIAVGEYGSHGLCGGVWYSRDYGQTFNKVFWHEKYAPDYAHAHVHGVCIDPYFDRLYVIVGDGLPSTTTELQWKNSRVYYWDYNNEVLSDTSWDTLIWKYVEIGTNLSLGNNLQFVNGYALKDCVIFGSDGSRGGFFRFNRTTKEDILIPDFAVDFGNSIHSTTWCGGNMFRRDSKSPLLLCIHREYSNDLEPTDTVNNPSGAPNTYKDVLSRVLATWDGYEFFELWIDDTYGNYNIWYSDGTPDTRNLAKCGRDMSVYQLPDGKVLLKYQGRQSTYVGYNNNGVTSNKSAYHRFNNEVVKFRLK